MTGEKSQLESASVRKPNHLFKPVSWLSKIDFINHLIAYNNVMMAVLAEKVGGKTAFLSLLQGNIDASIKSILITPTSPFDKQEFVKQIAEACNIKKQKDMRSVVAQINKQKSHVLVLVDDAQYLDDEWLSDTLSSIDQQGKQGYFHLCIAADYSIVPRLNALVNGQFKNLIHTIELSGLNAEETKTYLMHRAREEGINEKILSTGLLDKIYKVTAGDLSKINSNITHYFKGTLAAPVKSIRVFKRAGLAACVTLAAIGGAYTLTEQGYLPQFIKDKSVYELTHQVVQTIKPPAIVKHPVMKQMVSYLPHFTDKASHRFVEPSAPYQSTVASIEGGFPEQTRVMLDSVVYIPKIKFPEHKTLPKSKVQLSSSIEKMKALKQARRTESVPNPHSKKASRRYTIQLIASHREINVLRFAEHFHLTQQSTIYHTRPWYVLTVGEYDNLEQAKQGVRQLPPELTKLKPWIRPVSGLNNLG